MTERYCKYCLREGKQTVLKRKRYKKSSWENQDAWLNRQWCPDHTKVARKEGQANRDYSSYYYTKQRRSRKSIFQQFKEQMNIVDIWITQVRL